MSAHGRGLYFGVKLAFLCRGVVRSLRLPHGAHEHGGLHHMAVHVRSGLLFCCAVVAALGGGYSTDLCEPQPPLSSPDGLKDNALTFSLQRPCSRAVAFRCRGVRVRLMFRPKRRCALAMPPLTQKSPSAPDSRQVSVPLPQCSVPVPRSRVEGAGQAYDVVPCGASAEGLFGRTYYTTKKVRCPSGCAVSGHRVYGTGPFTDSSSVCVAAIYEGLLSNSGGEVQITWAPGQSTYAAGAQHNGVATAAWGQWPASFIFAGVAQALQRRPTPILQRWAHFTCGSACEEEHTFSRAVAFQSTLFGGHIITTACLVCLQGRC